MDAAVLDKIEAMMELQARAGTPAEAEAAAAGITRILTKHNLELAEVARRLGQKAPKSEYVQETIEFPGDDGWFRTLATVLASHNFCKFYAVKGTNVGKIVGERANIAVVTRLLFGLIPQLRNQGRVAYRQACANGTIATEWKADRNGDVWFAGRRGRWVPEGLWKYVGSFVRGAVMGIDAALTEAKKEAVAEPEHAELMMLPYAVQASGKATVGQAMRAAVERMYEGGEDAEFRVIEGPAALGSG